MAYPAPFHRLVLIGTLYSDIFNTTIAMVPTGGGGSLPAVTQELADAVRGEVELWFNDPLNASAPFGPGIISSAALTSIKLNRIGTDGRYMDPEAIESVCPTPFPGLSSATPPAQLSIAATLRGSNPRALAGRGRMFLPPSSIVTTMDSTGRISSANAVSYANSVSRLCAILNDVYITEGVTAVAGIASNTRTGAFQAVVDVTVGRTVDTIRSRRNKIPEDFVTATI